MDRHDATDDVADAISRSLLPGISALRGVNVSSYSKGMPFNPTAGSGEEFYPQMDRVFRPFGGHSTTSGLDRIRSLRFNCIRLLVTLEACFSQTGELSLQYIADVAETIAEAHKRNLFIVLDFHQDNYSRRLGGSGLADVFLPASMRSKQTLFKGLGESWGSQPLTNAQQYTCWKRFWDNAPADPMPHWPEFPLQDLYIHCITAVVRQLYTIKDIWIDAIDIMNEPCLPEVFLAQFLVLRSRVRTRRKQLISFYAHAIQSLVKVGFCGYYLIEPFNYDVSCIARFAIGLTSCCAKVLELNPGLDHNKLVFAPHCYQPMGHLGPSIATLIRNHLQTQEKGGFPHILIGELGDVTYGTVEGQRIIASQLQHLAVLDIPWILWEFCPTYERSEEDSRTAYRITGDLGCFPWNGEYCSIVGPQLDALPLYRSVVCHYVCEDQAETVKPVASEVALEDLVPTHCTTTLHSGEKTLCISHYSSLDTVSPSKLQELTKLAGTRITTNQTLKWYVLTPSTALNGAVSMRTHTGSYNVLGFKNYKDCSLFRVRYGGLILCTDKLLLGDGCMCDLQTR